MLCRSKGLGNLIKTQYRSFSAASDAFPNYEERIASLKSSYPNLFGDQFILDQESLLSSTKNDRLSLLNNYNECCDEIDKNSGESIFIKYDENNLPNSKSVCNIGTKYDQVETKLKIGQKCVDSLLKIQDLSGLSVEETNLRMIDIAKYADQIDDWRNRLKDDIDDTTDLGLPITDGELDSFVNYQYYHAPGNVRDQGILSNEEFQKVEQEWLDWLDEEVIKTLRQNDNFDENKWKEFTLTTNEMFHPHNIDHYTLSNYSKSLFRAGLWQGNDRLNNLEKSINKLNELLNDSKDNDTEIIRTMYENNPNFKFRKLVGLQLQITDSLFCAKICDYARSIMEECAINRAVKDVLRDLELPMILKEKDEWETELRESISTNPSTMKRKIELLRQEANSFEIEVPTLEDVLDDILPTKLWGNNIDDVKESILNYAKGNGSLNDIYNNINTTFDNDTETGTLNDSQKLEYAIQYHNARHNNKETWNLKDFLKSTNQYRKVQERIISKRLLKKRLDLLNIDPLAVNLIRILIDDKKTDNLQQIIYDYINIMKRYRGEIDGIILTPIKLDNNTLESINNAMINANPGKKITLKEQIEPSLSAGFIVKAGVQKFDFSLATVIHEGRKQFA